MLKLPSTLTELQKKEIVSFLISMQGGKVGHLSLKDCLSYGYDPHISYYRLANSAEFHPITDAVTHFSDFFYSQTGVINDVNKIGEIYSKSISNPGDLTSIRLRRGGVSSLLSYNEFYSILMNRLTTFDFNKAGAKGLITLVGDVVNDGGFVASFSPKKGESFELINKQWIASILNLSDLQFKAREALLTKSIDGLSEFVDSVWLSLSKVGAQPVLKKYSPFLDTDKDFPALLNSFLKVPSNHPDLSSRITEGVLSAMSACSVGLPIGNGAAPLDAGYAKKILSSLISEQLSANRNFSEWVTESFAPGKIQSLLNAYDSFTDAFEASVKRDEFMFKKHLDHFGYTAFHNSLEPYALSEHERLYLKSQSLKILSEHGSEGKQYISKAWSELAESSIHALSEIKQLATLRRLEFLDKSISGAPEPLKDSLLGHKNSKIGMITILSHPKKICLKESNDEINLRFGLFYKDYYDVLSGYIKKELLFIQSKGQEKKGDDILSGLNSLIESRSVFNLKTKSGDLLPSNEGRLVKEMLALISKIETVKNDISTERAISPQVDMFSTMSTTPSEVAPSLSESKEEMTHLQQDPIPTAFLKKEDEVSVSPSFTATPAWEMPQNEWAELQIKLSDYADEYLADQELYAGQLEIYKKRWVGEIKERATTERIKTDVLDSFVAEYGVNALLSEFRGVHELGVAGYEPPEYRLWDKTYSAVLKQAKTGELGATLDGQVRSLHVHCIQKALAAGESVPDNILKHYGLEKPSTDPHDNHLELAERNEGGLNRAANESALQVESANGEHEVVNNEPSCTQVSAEMTSEAIEELYDKFSDKFYKNDSVPTDLEEAYDWFNLLWEKEIESAPLNEAQDRINTWFARLNVSPLKKDIIAWFEDTAELHQLISSIEEKHSLHFPDGALPHVPSERVAKLIGEVFKPGTRIPLDDFSPDKARELIQQSDLLYKLNMVMNSPCVESFKSAIGEEKSDLGASFLLEYLAYNPAQKAIEKINELLSSNEQMALFLDRSVKNAKHSWAGVHLFLGKSLRVEPEVSLSVVHHPDVMVDPVVNKLKR